MKERLLVLILTSGVVWRGRIGQLAWSTKIRPTRAVKYHSLTECGRDEKTSAVVFRLISYCPPKDWQCTDDSSRVAYAWAAMTIFSLMARLHQQHVNGPARPLRYHALTEHGREVTACVVAFRPVSENSGVPLSPSSVHSSLHQIYYSFPRGRPSAGDPSAITNIHGRRAKHLSLACGERPRLPEYPSEVVPPGVDTAPECKSRVPCAYPVRCARAPAGGMPPGRPPTAPARRKTAEGRAIVTHP
ncbi:hypothetical protein EVAR_54975_1 [Eumeta japonica]|uniref:Secreted protein n=1 Tax=Eumeta variegata TaxID=151549 RepID=A0A4C1Z3R2_EUMVA|nr:hypothetical protein EVAR_54975_1 [Eumeta japonica]